MSTWRIYLTFIQAQNVACWQAVRDPISTERPGFGNRGPYCLDLEVIDTPSDAATNNAQQKRY